jgi:hypothetical protein
VHIPADGVRLQTGGTIMYLPTTPTTATPSIPLTR